MTATPTAEPAARARRTRIVRVAQVLFSVAIVVAIFAYAIPKFASYGAVWAVLRTLTWAQLGLLAAATVFNLITYWLQLMAALPGLTLGQAAVNNQTTTSIANTVPVAGGALSVGVSYAMLRSWGFSLAAITLMTILTGIWNAFLKLAMPIVAVALLAVTGSSTAALLAPALLGVAVLVGAVVLFALLMWKKELARRIGAAVGAAWSWLRRLVRKPPVTGWDQAAVRFRRQSNDLVARRWPALTLTTLVSHLGLYLVFLLTTRLVGITSAEVSWVELLGIFSLGRLLTAAPITPGGVGLVEFTLHRRAGAGGRRPGPRPGGRCGAAVPGADLWAADPPGRVHLPHLATQQVLAQAPAPRHAVRDAGTAEPTASVAGGRRSERLTSLSTVGGDLGKRRSAQRFLAVC
jgi:putative heme transporter